MKLKQSSLDIYAFVNLYRQDIIASFIKKIHQISQNEFVLQIYRSDLKKRDLLLSLSKGIAFFDTEKPEMPSGLAMQLRSMLVERRIISISQINFDRVVSIELSGGLSLIIELFREGNLIVVQDGIIQYALNPREWKNRKIVRGSGYIPPMTKNPLDLDVSDLVDVFKNSRGSLVQTIATRLNLGGEDAEEVLFRLGADKSMPAADFIPIPDLRKEIDDILSEALKNRSYYYQKEEILSPIELRHLGRPADKIFESFYEGLKYYLDNYPAGEVRESKNDRKIASIEKSIEEFSLRANEYRGIGTKIFSDLRKFDEIISAVRSREKELRPGTAIFQDYVVQSIDGGKKTVDVLIDGIKIPLRYNKRASENGNAAFAESKDYLAKIDGATKILEELKRSEVKELPGKRKKERRRFWFESYRWFITSEGNTVVAGKDRKTNEKVVKKHMEQFDIYVHADLYGAPSTVVKAVNSIRPGEKSISEAAQFAISYSRAWSAGQASGSAYWVFPEQVSKTPQSGEFISSGSWVIRGKRNYVFNLPLALYIGTYEIEGIKIPMASPDEQIFKEGCIKIIPGRSKRTEVAKEIADRLGFERDEIDSILPPGSSQII